MQAKLHITAECVDMVKVEGPTRADCFFPVKGFAVGAVCLTSPLVALG